MVNQEAILDYKASMYVFKHWLGSGLISGDELLAIDKMIASKYGLSSCSIYREHDLLSGKNGAIYGSERSAAYE